MSAHCYRCSRKQEQNQNLSMVIVSRRNTNLFLKAHFVSITKSFFKSSKFVGKNTDSLSCVWTRHYTFWILVFMEHTMWNELQDPFDFVVDVKISRRATAERSSSVSFLMTILPRGLVTFAQKPHTLLLMRATTKQ